MIGSIFLATVALLYYFNTQVHIHCVTFEEDAVLSESEATSLQKFRESIESNVPAEWMKKDNYLVRFLRGSNFDVDEAVKVMKAHFDWRKENRLDENPPEDFADLRKDYPYRTTAHDKAGRFILEWGLGTWNIKKAIENGWRDRLRRYTFAMWNEASRKTAEAAAAGKNVSRYTVLIDMDKFNPGDHINPESVKYYQRISDRYKNNFPNAVDKMFVIYGPPEFVLLLKDMQPLLSAFTADNLILFGLNSTVWKKKLEKSIDLSELAEGTIHD